MTKEILEKMENLQEVIIKRTTDILETKTDINVSYDDAYRVAIVEQLAIIETKIEIVIQTLNNTLNQSKSK